MDRRNIGHRTGFLPGGLLGDAPPPKPPIFRGGLLDQAALASAPVPVAGDIFGLLADANMFMREPET